MKKAAFLNRYNPNRSVEVALSSGVKASVQHNSLYADNAPREEIRSEWKKFLNALQETYKTVQSTEKYESDIETLKNHMNQRFASYFRSEKHPRYNTDGGFRISHAQKSISVYLKHMWCMDLIETPPQCPVDGIILKSAGCTSANRTWGYVNSIEEHRKKLNYLIEAKNKTHPHISLAEWELLTFSVSA